MRSGQFRPHAHVPHGHGWIHGGELDGWIAPAPAPDSLERNMPSARGRGSAGYACRAGAPRGHMESAILGRGICLCLWPCCRRKAVGNGFSQLAFWQQRTRVDPASFQWTNQFLGFQFHVPIGVNLKFFASGFVYV
jgi:hypothetical protein